MNKHDIYVWIEKIIDSCENSVQLLKCIKLIQRFEIKYPENSGTLVRTLRLKRLNKLLNLYYEKNN